MCLAVLLFLVLPVLIIVPMSFNESDYFVYPFPGFSTKWYFSFYNDPVWISTIKNSLFVSVLAATLATVIGTLASIGIARSRSGFKVLVFAALMFPMIVPLVVTGVAMFLFYSALGIAGSYVGLIIAHAVLGIPFVVVTVTATLENFNDNLRLAALSLGASPFQALTGVVVPIIAPGIISGALFAFFVSFDEVVVTLFLASPQQRTLPVHMFSGLRESISPTITAVATQLIIVACALMFVLEWLRRREHRLRGLRAGGES
jgi:putative spermidine/putrescine transport system permease protein